MKSETILLIGAILIIIGATLKILHVFDPWNNLIFNGGIGISGAYLVLKYKPKKKEIQK